VSFGRRGAHVTVGPKGTRETVGIPGTGISYTTTQPAHHQAHAPIESAPAAPVPPIAPTPRRSRLAFAIWFVAGAVVMWWLVTFVGSLGGRP